MGCGAHPSSILLYNHFCAIASSDLTCFFKRRVHSCCYEPYLHTSPRQLHWPLTVVAPSCLPSHSLLDHVSQIQYTVAPSDPGVCVFDMPGPESFVHSFMYSFNHEAFMYRHCTRPWRCKDVTQVLQSRDHILVFRGKRHSGGS